MGGAGAVSMEVVEGVSRVACLSRPKGFPTTDGGMQNGSSVGVRVRVAHTFFARFRVDSYAQSVLIDEISASELSRKFIKSALLVGLLLRHCCRQ